MAESTIVRSMITRLGQSQDERLPDELDASFDGFVKVDEHTRQELLLFAQQFAALVNYFGTDGSTGDWTPFFTLEDDAGLSSILTQTDGAVPPHLALLATMLELYDVPRAAINTLTTRHLDFFYERVLGFAAAAPTPDTAHVLIELKKGTSPVAITTGHVFTAGKDEAGVELLYSPTHETVVSGAGVAALCSVLVDDAATGGVVRFSPIANSADGAGEKLDEDDPQWPAFGTTGRPAADIGFAVAAPALRMAEGDRTITLTLALDGIDTGTLTSTALGDALTTYLTGDEGWIGPVAPTVSVSSSALTLTIALEEDDPPVVDYDAEIHAHAFPADAPIIQVLFVAGTGLGYEDLKGLTISTAEVSVSVSGLKTLALESDLGTLDPKKAFLPWGAQPVEGSRFKIASTELLEKKLKSVTINVGWLGAPDDFSTWYDGYGNKKVDDGYFTASASFIDGVGKTFSEKKLALFETTGADATGSLTLSNEDNKGKSSRKAGEKTGKFSGAASRWALGESLRGTLLKPTSASRSGASDRAKKKTSKAAASTSGASHDFIVVTLDKSFLHSEYRRKSIEKVLEAIATEDQTPTVLNEPYTPTISSISIDYVTKAESASIDKATASAFADTDVQFFHVGCFGQMREHAYQRRQFDDFLPGTDVPLLPQYDYSGELCIGLTGLEPGGSTSILFQVAEGSADPDVEPPDVEWAVLCDNYWKPLETGEVTRDTTGNLLTSGTIGFVIPSEATTVNTMMPTGYIWLRGAVARDAAAASKLIDVQANAVEVTLKDPAASPSHLAQALPAESIAKLKKPIAAVKAVTQPYASFGGALEESEAALRTRAAERLRHRNRAVTSWDYERLVLGAFPKVHRVKCIPHAKDGNWLAPGYTRVVVVPDLKNQNAVDPLQPKVDAATISDITGYLTAHAGMGVRLTVSNPRYQQVRLDLKVKFRAGYEFNYYQQQVQQALIEFLSPWAFSTGRSMAFGGKVYKSVLLDVVEELACVDYVTEVRMYASSVDGTMGTTDVDEVSADTPDAILVSYATHAISEAD